MKNILKYWKKMKKGNDEIDMMLLETNIEGLTQNLKYWSKDHERVSEKVRRWTARQKWIEERKQRIRKELRQLYKKKEEMTR